MREIILFLASEPTIRRVIGSALESKGYCVLNVPDLADAVDRLKECTPDLLLVRHYTSSISGHEAAIYLRKICPGIPVLLVGGILDDEELEDREILQGFEIFPKPFTTIELLGKVREVLNKHSLLNQIQ